MDKTVPADEVKIVDGLNQIVAQTTDHLMAIETMINMYNNIENKSDRDRTRPILLAYLRLNSEYSQKQADRIAAVSGQGKTTAVSQISSRIRDEMGASVLTLKTISITIQFEVPGK